jgi:hypothetical protein
MQTVVMPIVFCLEKTYKVLLALGKEEFLHGGREYSSQAESNRSLYEGDENMGSLGRQTH